jgi:restriction system protein
MDLPKYHETFIPILEILNSIESINSRELTFLVRDNYYSDLPAELKNQKTSSGANVLIDRILWGKSYLKMGKFVTYPKRGLVQITEKGKKRLKVGNLPLHDLQNDLDFINHRKSVKSEKENVIELDTLRVDNSSPQDLID